LGLDDATAINQGGLIVEHGKTPDGAYHGYRSIRTNDPPRPVERVVQAIDGQALKE
jgi:hypothetical protein